MAATRASAKSTAAKPVDDETRPVPGRDDTRPVPSSGDETRPMPAAAGDGQTAPNGEVYERIDRWVDEHFDEQVRFLQELVRVPTDTPPGHNAPHAERTAGMLGMM